MYDDFVDRFPLLSLFLPFVRALTRVPAIVAEAVAAAAAPFFTVVVAAAAAAVTAVRYTSSSSSDFSALHISHISALYPFQVSHSGHIQLPSLRCFGTGFGSSFIFGFGSSFFFDFSGLIFGPGSWSCAVDDPVPLFLRPPIAAAVAEEALLSGNKMPGTWRFDSIDLSEARALVCALRAGIVGAAGAGAVVVAVAAGAIVAACGSDDEHDADADDDDDDDDGGAEAFDAGRATPPARARVVALVVAVVVVVVGAATDADAARNFALFPN